MFANQVPFFASAVDHRHGFLRPLRRTASTVAIIGVLLITRQGIAQGQPASEDLPTAPRVLPVDTMVYVQLDSADGFREDLSNTSLGKMIADPKLRPFADDFYATARDLFDSVSEQVGVNLDELLAIPQGQVAFAVIPAKPMDEGEKPEFQPRENESEDEAAQRRDRVRRREAYGFGVNLIIHAGDNIDDLMAIADRIETQMIKQGSVRRVREIEGTQITRLLPRRPGSQPLEFFQRDGTLVLGVGHEAAQDVLKHWLDESDDPTLAENATFGTIMSRCIGAETTRPQLTFFVDPHQIIDRVVKRSGSLSAGFVWPVIEEMGANRVGGIGGSSFRGGETFESIVHYHLQLDPPRDGVLGVVRPGKGDTTPPKWVPQSVAGYTTITWDIPKAYENFGKVLDKFQGENSLKRLVETPIEKRLGLSIQEDLLGNITGRVIRATWMEPPTRINSGVTTMALELKDPIKAKSAIAQIRDRMPDRLTVDSVSGHVVYRMRTPMRNLPDGLRRPEPGFMLVDNWLIYSDSTTFMEKAALANAGNLPRLIELPEYELVAGELGGKLDGADPFLLSFIDAAQGVKLIYDLVKDEKSRRFLRRAGENNVVARKFADLLERNELPPFSQFEQYFAPTGMFGYDEANGIHFGFFTLRATPLETSDE